MVGENGEPRSGGAEADLLASVAARARPDPDRMNEFRPDALAANLASRPLGSPAPVLPLSPLTVRDPWLARLTLVLLVLGLIGAALLGWQMMLVKSQVDTMQAAVAQGQKSIEATARLADAATQSNEIANQVLAAGNRPWIGVDTVEAAAPQPNQPLTLEVRVRNSGRSPSVDLQGLFLVYISPIDSPPALLSEPCTTCVRSVLLPNGITTYKLAVRDTVMTPDEVARIREGKDTMWIVGRLDYRDGEGEAHSTKSCLFYRTTGIASFSACNDGNFAN
jgi:hypothetical protein